MILEVLLAVVMASDHPAGTPAGQPAVALHSQAAPAKAIGGLWEQLGVAIRAEDTAAALTSAKAIAEHPDFAAETAERRSLITVLLGLLYSGEGQDAAALPYLIEASERPGASVDVWFARITSHARTDDRTAAARATARLLALHPDVVSNLSSPFILQIENSDEVDPDAAFELRRALQDAGWRDRFDSWIWVRLIDDLRERGRDDEAVELVGRVTASGALMHLHAMRRYDDLRGAAALADLDIAAILEAELQTRRTEAEASGAEFEARNAYASGLFNRGRFDEALAFTEATLALPAPEPATEDDRSLTWTMDARARALMELGRRDEAIAQMEIAAKRDEGGGTNVSQTINLGWFYLRAGENQKAIEAVKSLQAGSASPFGIMQAMHVRGCAGVALGEERIAGPAFAHMEQNWRDAPLTWVEAQACRGESDGAADTLLRILGDEDLSDRAVGAMHTYLVSQRATEFDRRVADALAVAVARPDVVAARDRIARALVIPTLSNQF